ncbi:NAD-dependent epimerase/dehydratase family protein [Salisediminibacterium halotolerans]|uniref:Uncharacterized conserved protein YbjT, contains NAD(P)-binding and DUF2867 domains n=1 Tax=Salisediminibacterium halotolerans TaxID=517425 RepID=A0A1H9WPU6_9BACI|nr:NAD-dependent epimerase/dehydratase family protein [Salisediminibacterium haloalkalitolerans]SES35942.1 Uncharacterized conserved protein YbjT, contains NAD(P)-binding and DUF2867 domains [Salisediminibacterium haloalkalitolerans]
MKRAIVAGATGLVGTRLVKELLSAGTYDEVHLLTRRRTIFHKEPTVAEHLVSFDHLEEAESVFQPGDDVFVTLGTTMKQAGSQEKFIDVDYHYPRKIAEFAAAHEAGAFLIITAMGADRGSRFFYNIVKGSLEDTLMQTGLNSLHIFRPSLLVGVRHDTRPGEKAAEWIGRPLAPLLRGKWEKYKPVHAKDVALAMQAAAGVERTGIHIYESDDIQRIAQAVK